MRPRELKGRIGIALGSGASRGWAHVGVIRQLRAMGISPQVVCGASAGAIVGAVYAAGRLDDFERWGRQLDRRQVMAMLDLSLRGGVVRGRRLMDEVAKYLPDGDVGALPLPFAAVATDLETGQEVWLRDGPLVDAIHASLAMPGFVTPLRWRDRWLVDGGVVNPVPVSLCRAMGADSVIAVDLNTTLLGRRFRDEASAPAPEEAAAAGASDPTAGTLQVLLADLRQRLGGGAEAGGESRPGFYDVVSNAIEIMQVRITRSRMGGDPPELLVTPRLGDFALLDFDRAIEAIEEGRHAVDRALPGRSGGSGTFLA